MKKITFLLLGLFLMLNGFNLIANSNGTDPDPLTKFKSNRLMIQKPLHIKIKKLRRGFFSVSMIKIRDRLNKTGLKEIVTIRIQPLQGKKYVNLGSYAPSGITGKKEFLFKTIPNAFEDPLTAFEDPLTAFEDPLTAFEDPLTARNNHKRREIKCKLIFINKSGDILAKSSAFLELIK